MQSVFQRGHSLHPHLCIMKYPSAKDKHETSAASKSNAENLGDLNDSLTLYLPFYTEFRLNFIHC